MESGSVGGEGPRAVAGPAQPTILGGKPHGGGSLGMNQQRPCAARCGGVVRERA